MEKNEGKFFIGIDLGWKEKKTTGVCVLTKDKCLKCEDVFGKDVLKVIQSYLKDTETIAIDAPLTKGRGKGKMRLYEKFLSMAAFRQAKICQSFHFGKKIGARLKYRYLITNIFK